MNDSLHRYLADTWYGRAVLVAAVLILLLGGCTRAHYRRQADREVYGLVDCGSRDPRWPLEDFTIEPDCRSRFYDPDDPDRPPMPPDDPTSHRLMHCVDCKKGWPHWHRCGDTCEVENPCWRVHLPTDKSGTVVLNRQTVMQLALLHSREYQRQVEQVYLSALDVSLQRFVFDTQFFGGHDTFFTTKGRLVGQTGEGTQTAGQSQSTLQLDDTLALKRKLATGGELAAGLANSLIWQFSGPDQYSAFTIMDFSLFQPLLRGAGRAVVLEALTDAERTLLGNIRQMEQFRRGFYGQIIAGLNPGAGPSRGGAFLAPPTLGGSGGGGFLGLLEEEVQIRNQRSNVDSLEDSLELLQAVYEAGRLENRYQVDLARQALLDAQSRLLAIRASHEDRLDTYKITLGLPPDLNVRVEDDWLKDFDLMDPQLMALREDVATLLHTLRDEGHPLPPDYLQKVSEVGQRAGEQLAVVRRDMQRLLDALPARRENLARLASRPELRNGEVDPSVADVGALNQRVETLRAEFDTLSGKLEQTLAAVTSYQPPEVPAAPEGPANAAPPRDKRLQDLVATLDDQLLQLSVDQAMARLDMITIVPVDLEPEDALAIARENRLDWMNARAALVDSWRQIEVTANRLKAGLDVNVSGNISTTDNNPFRFRAPTGTMRVGLQFDAPFTRLQERNLYREALISYQDARRNYTAFVDRLNQSLRNTLRTLYLMQLNLEIRRAAVVVAITQVDLSRMRLLRPPKAGETSQMGATIARDLVTAITSLLGSQDSFLAVWVDYETQRMSLDFQLGTMQLDESGVWVDPGAITKAKYAVPDISEHNPPEAEPAPMPPELPFQKPGTTPP